MLGGVRIWDRGTGEPGERAGVCAGAGLRASWLLARSQLLGPPPPVPETAGPRACCCGAGLLGAPAGSGPPQTERFVSTEPLACGGSRSPARCGGACAHVPDTTEAVGVGGAGRRGFETEPACDRVTGWACSSDSNVMGRSLSSFLQQLHPAPSPAAFGVLGPRLPGAGLGGTYSVVPRPG